MKIIREYVREYARQVIKESAGSSAHLGAIVWLEGERRNAVIYDPRSLGNVPNLLPRMHRDWRGLQQSLCDTVIKGMIDVGPWFGGESKCNGAWAVFRSAGPGMGKIVYSVGYALSPKGRLMSDRLSVSDKAKSAWASVAGKSQYKKFTLDDEAAHAEDGTSKYDHANHTDDPSDDCTLYRGPSGDEDPQNYSYLQNAYQGTGEEQALLSDMRNNSDAALKELFPGWEEEVEGLLKSASGPFFSIHYNSL